jgi:ketosteroid isomerase-like protein
MALFSNFRFNPKSTMKKAYTLLFSVVVLVACNNPQTPVAATVNATTDNNVAVVRQMFDAFNTHDWARMYSFYDPGARYLDPAFGLEYVMKTEEEIVGKYTGMQKYFPDIRDSLTGVYPSGDKVIVEFISMGKAADGTSFKLPIVSILTVRDGKIVTDATYYDNN